MAALGRLAAPDLAALAGCDLIVEAAPEDLELKRELFAAPPPWPRARRFWRPTPPPSRSPRSPRRRAPERIVGMHFFNPPAAMKLVEIVAGERSGGRR